jgi:hypothetical protein
MFQICQNNPEFIKNLADKIINGEQIKFYPIIGIGKSTFNFNMNLIKEIFQKKMPKY